MSARTNLSPNGMWWVALALASQLLACSGLDEGDVDSLEPGDATGNAASGRYRFELVSADASCDAGLLLMRDRTVEGVITQDDGELTFQMQEDELMPELTRFEGGLDADGGFEVGGKDTSPFTIIGLISGTLDGDSCSADYEFRAFDAEKDDNLECTSNGTVKCTRIE